jgi:hypothetical protein
MDAAVNPRTTPTSLVELAATACIPLECAAAILSTAQGYIVWVPFEKFNNHELTCTFGVFSSLEKAKKAYPCTGGVSYDYMPYRMHHCGSKDKIYIYQHIHALDVITITNVAEDLFNLASAAPLLFANIRVLSDVDKFMCLLDTA